MTDLSHEQIRTIQFMASRNVSEYYICNTFSIRKTQLKRVLGFDLSAIPESNGKRHKAKRSEADAVDSMLARGMGPVEVAARLRVPESYVVHRQRKRLYAVGLADSVDSSCPKFSDDEACISAVMGAGGFPRAERVRGKTVWLDWRGNPWREVRA